MRVMRPAAAIAIVLAAFALPGPAGADEKCGVPVPLHAEAEFRQVLRGGEGAENVLQSWQSFAFDFDGSTATVRWPKAPERHVERFTIERCDGDRASGTVRLLFTKFDASHDRDRQRL